MNREKKDLIEIPKADYQEDRPDGDEPFAGITYIENAIGGHYLLKILQVPSKNYIMQVASDHDSVLLEDVPIKKGEIHIYDIEYDRNSDKIRVSRRKVPPQK
jgi:hypothetical protein